MGMGWGLGLWVGVGLAQADVTGSIVRTVPADLPALRIEAGAAAVVVQADPTLSRSRIEVVPERWSSACTVDFGGTAAEARVQIRSGDSRAGLGCRGLITVTLAGETALTLDVHAADIALSPIPGPLQIHMEIGGVEGVVGVAGATLEAAQAQVHLWDVAGPVHADVQIGAVEVHYGQPLYAETRIYSDIGVIRVSLPTPVHVRAQPGAGGYHNTLPPTPVGTAGALDLRTRLGSITVSPTRPTTPRGPL